MEKVNLDDDFDAADILSLCSDLVKELFTAASVDQLINISENVFERFIPLDYSGLYLYNEDLDRLELQIARGFSAEEKIAAEQTAMQRHPGTVFKTGKQIYIPNTDEDEQKLTIDSPRSFVVKTRLYSPVEVGGKRIGVFGVVSSRPNAFSASDIELFRFICKIVSKVFINIKNRDKLLKLNREQKILTFLATHTDNSVVLTDNLGLVTWVNDEFVRLTGFSLSEVKGKKPGELLQREGSEPAVIKYIGKALRDREVFNGIITNYSKSGEKYLVDLAIYPFYNDEGEFSNYISFQRNVTKEVDYKRQIENQKQRLDAILSSIPDILFVIESKGIISECIVNKDFYDFTITDKYLGTSIFKLVKGEDTELLQRYLTTVFSNSEIQTGEVSLNLNNKSIYVEIRLVRMDEQNALCLVRNINEKFLMDQERIQNQQFNDFLSEYSIRFSLAEAEDTSEVINEFIQSVGHVLNAGHSFYIELNSKDSEFSSRSFSFLHKKWAFENASFESENEIITNSVISTDELFLFSAEFIVSKLELGAKSKIIKALQLGKFKNLAVLPLRQNGQLVALFGFSDLNTEDRIKDALFSKLKLVAKLIDAAVSRMNYILELSRFKAIFDNSSFGAAILNHRNEIVYSNAYVSNYFVYSEQQLDPANAHYLFSNIVNSEVFLEYNCLLNYKADVPLIIQVDNPVNNERSHLLMRHLVFEVKNRNPLIAISFIDITDRINQENETLKAIDIVSEQNKKLLNFSYIVSHNIRSHVSNIVGFLSLAETEDDIEKLRSYIDILIKTSKSLDGTLKHLNELLNIQSRTGVLTVHVNLLDLFNKTIQALSSDLVSILNEIKFNIPEGFSIQCDQAYADSIVLNLLSNAIKYRKKEAILKIEVDAWYAADKSYFKISDNGKGVDLEKYGEKIFGMFKTFHGNRDARGIGLFITKNQIESLGGSIHLESSPGNGATFTIELPNLKL